MKNQSTIHCWSCSSIGEILLEKLLILWQDWSTEDSSESET